MTQEEAVYDLMMEAEGFQLSDDSRYDEYDYMAYLLDEKRAIVIRDNFKKNGAIHPETIQNLYQYAVTKVSANDDSSLPFELEMGKVSIPQLASFHDDTPEFSRGIVRLSSKNIAKRFYQTSENKFQLINELGGERKELFQYFYLRGTDLYIYPFVETIDLSAIIARPLEGFVLDSTYRTALVVGTSYTVIQGSITENSIVYQAGDVFTAGTTSFTGSGKVILTVAKRSMLKTDNYPMTENMMDLIKKLMINTEFRLGSTQQSDGRNDSADTETKASQE